MELFTRLLETKDLKTLLEEKLRVKDVKFVVFDNIPDMNWVQFKYKGFDFEFHHHTHASRYGFEGSLITVSQRGFQRTNPEIEMHEELLRHLAESLGGLLDTGGGDNLEGIERPGQDGSEFLLNQLRLNGVDDEEICDALEIIRMKKGISKNSNC